MLREFPPRERNATCSRAAVHLVCGWLAQASPATKACPDCSSTQNTSSFLLEGSKSNHQAPNIKALPRFMRITHATNPSTRPTHGTHPWLHQEMIRRHGQSNWDGEGRPNPSLRFAPHMPGQSKSFIYRNVHPSPFFITPK